MKKTRTPSEEHDEQGPSSGESAPRGEPTAADRRSPMDRLAERGNVGIWQIRTDGTTVYANAAMRRLLEVDPETPIEGTYHRFFSERSLPTFEREHPKRREGAASTYEVELIGARGARRDVVISGVPVMDEAGRLQSLIGAFIEVTDLRKAERELAASETRYRTLFELGSDAIFVTDATGRYVDVNRRACEVMGYRREELLQLRAHDLLTDEELHREPPALDRLASGEAMLRERELKRKDGSVFTAELSVRPLPDGRILGFVRDVTERKRAEREKLRLEKQLQSSRRLESLGRLAGGVAHDFNNLLTAIVCHAEALEDVARSGEAAAQEVAGIRDAAGRATELARQLLSFGRHQVMHTEVVDLGRHLHETHALLRRLLPEHVELRARIPEGLSVDVEPAKLDQIVMNLVLNARDAMPQGGLIDITGYTKRLDAEALPGLRAGDYVLLEVRDTGEGMDEETQSHIFEPFFSTKEDASGTGLGLATTYGIVAQHGGQVDVRSAPGKGATFLVCLPSSSRADAAARLASLKPPLEAPRKTRILLAEDEGMVRRVTMRVLEAHGYDVHGAADAKEAMDLAASYPPDLLLTDVVMPDRSGVELYRVLKKQLPELRVVFMSGYAPDEPATKMDWSDPKVRFLAKPFSPEVLLREVVEALP